MGITGSTPEPEPPQPPQRPLTLAQSNHHKQGGLNVLRRMKTIMVNETSKLQQTNIKSIDITQDGTRIQVTHFVTDDPHSDTLELWKQVANQIIVFIPDTNNGNWAWQICQTNSVTERIPDIQCVLKPDQNAGLGEAPDPDRATVVYWDVAHTEDEIKAALFEIVPENHHSYIRFIRRPNRQEEYVARIMPNQLGKSD